METGRLSEAEEVIRQAVSLEPSRAAGHMDLALVLNALGRKGESLMAARRAVELEPQNPKIQAQYKILQEQAR
jgi:Flp pilus assembly protein TadD